MHAIQVQGLTKRYGDVTAVDGIAFSVASGGTLGLLGGNGAGKTTTRPPAPSASWGTTWRATASRLWPG